MSHVDIQHKIYEQSRRDHDDLRELIGEAHRALTQRNDSVDKIVDLLASVKAHIEKHFLEEEKEGGIFKQAVEQAPRLVGRADQIRNEHESLLKAIKKIADQSRKNQGSLLWWRELEEHFHAFSTDLMHHEADEVLLLQDAYTQDIGSQD